MISLVIGCLSSFGLVPAGSSDPPPMELRTDSFLAGEALPARLALARSDSSSHVAFSGNRSPHLEWSGVPDGALSFSVVCTDRDAPTVGDDVNREGVTVPGDLPRCDFVHWVMVDIPAGVTGLEEGACSEGVTPGGKSSPRGPAGSRQGLNDYTGWFAGDAGMEGSYLGYDGPAPPWNDERIHHYCFEVFALDVQRLAVVGQFGLPEVRVAMQGHVLASAQLTGTYCLNPDIST